LVRPAVRFGLEQGAGGGQGIAFPLEGREPGSNQQDFFEKHVKVHLDAGIKRVFVVISDAFRFEAAEELVRDINGKSRFKAALTPMLGRFAELHRAWHGRAACRTKPSPTRRTPTSS
jgi:hypothetical protein